MKPATRLELNAKSQALLSALRKDPTERGLGNVIDDRNAAIYGAYVIQHFYSDIDGFIGRILIPLDDQILVIPFLDVSLNHGWEQLSLESAWAMRRELAFEAALNSYTVASDSLAALVEQAMTRVEPIHAAVEADAIDVSGARTVKAAQNKPSQDRGGPER